MNLVDQVLRNEERFRWLRKRQRPLGELCKPICPDELKHYCQWPESPGAVKPRCLNFVRVLVRGP